MNFKKHMLLALLAGTLAATTAGLASCGGGSPSSPTAGPGGDPTNGDPTTAPVDPADPIFDISNLENDVEYEDNGSPIFVGTEVKIWSIIGDPDLSVLKTLIDEFNMEYRGKIKMTLTSIGHDDFYNTLDTTWTLAPEDMPDLLLMHNEKTAEYVNKEMLLPLDKVMETYNFNMDLSQVFENIDRGQHWKGARFGVPVDAHGFLTHFRQDIIKKNNLGWDDNTRYIPETRAEYQELLENARAKADANQLLVRSILKGEDHSWRTVNPANFYPEFNQSTDPDGLGSIYANGDRLANEDGSVIEFQNSKGFQTYLTDIVDRWNNKLMGEPGTNVEGFSKGNLLLFNEGPWWTSLNYDPNMNIKELKAESLGGTYETVGKNLGVTEEDANDPIYSQPLVAMNSAGFWTLEENMDKPTADMWYGNGHAFSITRRCESATTALAALEFAKWYTQGKDDDGHYHLAKWATGGHIPAWKNVWEDAHYQEVHNGDLTLRALGSPEKIIAMEPLPYESTIFNAVATSANNVIMGCKGGTVSTHEDALQILKDVTDSAQTALDSLFGAW